MAQVEILVEVDGRPATVADLTTVALSNYGHFTAMQVRGGLVRRPDLHLARLASATRELFDADLDLDAVRGHIRHALLGRPDASVRVSIYLGDDTLSTMVAVRPPAEPPAAVRLHAVVYQRPVAPVKHVGTFGQIYYGRVAQRAGFDDALLTTADGVVSETAVANVGFVRDGTVIWPDAPHLRGTGLQLLESALAAAGWTQTAAEVRLAGLADFDAAFVVNSRGVSPVTRIDDRTFPVADPAVAQLTEQYEATDWHAF